MPERLTVKLKISQSCSLRKNSRNLCPDLKHCILTSKYTKCAPLDPLAGFDGQGRCPKAVEGKGKEERERGGKGMGGMIPPPASPGSVSLSLVDADQDGCTETFLTIVISVGGVLLLLMLVCTDVKLNYNNTCTVYNQN